MTVKGQTPIQRVEPPNWWIGFKDTNLQLMLYGEQLANYIPSISGSDVMLSDFHKGESSNYLFLDLIIPQHVKAGNFLINLKDTNGPSFSFSYPLEKRSRDAEAYRGFSSEDVIYLISPDRFANGNPAIDVDQSLKEKVVNRNDPYARHGGDIQGMIDHLDYIESMGFTAIWPSPMLLNDMPRTSYHGYAITDYYMVDPRFGSLEEYKDLATQARNKGIKLIMDQVNNHCGLAHWWMQDLPFKNWINEQEAFEKGETVEITNHRRTVNQDLYAAEIDKKQMEQGWFVLTMPDLNQRNSFMAQYLIQNSLWWIETLGLEGIRQDTYPYSDKKFMASWAQRIMMEYPEFSMVGEEWSYNPLTVGYWQRNAGNKDGYESYLRSPMDFPLQKTLVEALNEPEDLESGLIKLYEGLANDFHYANPNDLMFFADNHDMDRIFTQLNKDVALTKMAMAFVLMAPRIPQVYYGTEILLDNSDKPGDHGLIRSDFPGGWEGDRINAFTGEGLGDEAKEMQEFMRSLLQFRKKQSVIHRGETRHFSPEHGVYLLVRYQEDKKVVLILNKNNEETSLGLNRFSELQLKGVEFQDVISKDKVLWDKNLVLRPKSALILTT